jgi:hypothetical protein
VQLKARYSPFCFPGWKGKPAITYFYQATPANFSRKNILDEYEASYMVGMMVNVAIITIGSSLRTFILAMTMHP